MIRAAGWLVAAALAAGCATDNSAGGSSHIGKVEAVYVEQYEGVFVDRHVFVDRQMAQSDAGKPVWVYVTFDQPLRDGRRFATAVVEQDPGLEPGDLVQLRLARTGVSQNGAAPTRNQVIALVAKRDTAQARAFGTAQASGSDALRQAAVDPRP